MRVVLAVVLLAVSISPAFAQGFYVGGSLVGNIERWSGATTVLGGPDGGESLGGGVRIGTAISDRWGVDGEFVFPGSIEWEPDTRILGQDILPGGLSIYVPTLHYRTRTNTFTSMLWVKQSPSARFDLVYLGGIGSLGGSILGATVFTVVMEGLRSVLQQIGISQEWRLVVAPMMLIRWWLSACLWMLRRGIA